MSVSFGLEIKYSVMTLFNLENIYSVLFFCGYTAEDMSKVAALHSP